MDRFNELLLLVEKTSKKEQHRIDKFLKRHNYDPKTGTIETDEVGKDGKKIRVKFNMTNGPAFSDHVVSSPHDKDSFTIEMPRKSLKRKPMLSDGALKHEEGHIAYKRNPEKYKELYDKAKKAIEDDKTEKNDHDKNPEEYVADWYSAKHSKYGVDGFNKMINSTKRSGKDIKDKIKYVNDFFIKNKDITSADIKSIEQNIRVAKQMLKSRQKQLCDHTTELNELKLKLSKAKKGHANSKDISNMESDIKALSYMVSIFDSRNVDKYTQEIKSLEDKLAKSKNNVRSTEDSKRLVDSNKHNIRYNVKNEYDAINNGSNLRQKFVNDNIKESADVLLDIYEAEYNGDITLEERDVLLTYLNEKRG